MKKSTPIYAINAFKPSAIRRAIASIFAFDDCKPGHFTIKAIPVDCVILSSRYAPTIVNIASVLKVSPEKVYRFFKSNGYILPKRSHSFIPEEVKLDARGISLVAKMNLSLLRNYYVRCVRMYDSLSLCERKAFKEFKEKYARKGRVVHSWRDIDTRKITLDFYSELAAKLGDDSSRYLWETAEQVRTLDRVRQSYIYKSADSAEYTVMDRRRQFRSVLETFIEHRYHIFTSDSEAEDSVSSDYIVSYSN